MTAGIQILNAIGALTLVYAFRYGKAMVVAPLTNAGAPLVTAVLALVFRRRRARPAEDPGPGAGAGRVAAAGARARASRAAGRLAHERPAQT